MRQADEKLVLAGSRNFNSVVAVVRYNVNGTLDASFGSGGIVITPVSNITQTAAVAIQPDGKIVAAGTVANAATQTDALVVRCSTDGSIDTTFGTGGFVTSDIGGLEQQSFAVALQPDGKIVTAGYSSNGTREDIAVRRYLGDTVSTVRRAGFNFDGDGK